MFDTQIIKYQIRCNKKLYTFYLPTPIDLFNENYSNSTIKKNIVNFLKNLIGVKLIKNVDYWFMSGNYDYLNFPKKCPVCIELTCIYGKDDRKLKILSFTNPEYTTTDFQIKYVDIHAKKNYERYGAEYVSKQFYPNLKKDFLQELIDNDFIQTRDL